MYSHKYNLILGFHGCDEDLRNQVVSGEKFLKESHNEYDWLGHGIYFWENNPDRALSWAEFLKGHPRKEKPKIETPAVLGAVIDLGFCLDLLTTSYITLLKETFLTLESIHKKQGTPVPKNKRPIVTEKDLLLRNLDCAVIEYLHSIRSEKGRPPFDSIRGVFWEGKEIYKNAGFKEKNHIQICIRNPNCIKGFFVPRQDDDNYVSV